jgi:pyrophosphatase PpaX
MNFSAILFDLDGTLIDTGELILTSFRYATRKVLERVIPDDELMDLVGIPLAKQMEMIDAEHAEELTAVYREHNARVHDELIHEFVGTREALEELKAGGIPLVVVTSKRNELAERGLNCFGLLGFFDFLIGSDDTELHKPNPEPLLLAAERLGVPIAECVYLGDSPYDMQAARAAGALAVAATWGVFSRERLLEAGAEWEIAALGELPGLLSSL